MFDRIVLGIGAAASTAGVALQGVGLGDTGGLKLKIIAIACSAVGAGCLAMSPSVRGAAKNGDGNAA